MRKDYKTFILAVLATFLVMGLLSAPALAESNSGAASAQARLDFQITIPSILYLQVGTDGAIVDLVSCTLTQTPGTGAVAMTSSGSNPVPVIMRALVASGQTVNLTADSSSGLNGGAMPFSEISWAAGGVLSNGTFNNGVAQPLYNFAGPGEHIGDYAFSYANANFYPTGTYNGTVTYTLSTP